MRVIGSGAKLKLDELQPNSLFSGKHFNVVERQHNGALFRIHPSRQQDVARVRFCSSGGVHDGKGRCDGDEAYHEYGNTEDQERGREGAYAQERRKSTCNQGKNCWGYWVVVSSPLQLSL